MNKERVSIELSTQLHFYWDWQGEWQNGDWVDKEEKWQSGESPCRTPHKDESGWTWGSELPEPPRVVVIHQKPRRMRPPKRVRLEQKALLAKLPAPPAYPPLPPCSPPKEVEISDAKSVEQVEEVKGKYVGGKVL